MRKIFPRQVGLWRGSFLPPAAKRLLAAGRGSLPPRATRPMSEETAAWIRRALRSDVEAVRGYLETDPVGWEVLR